MQRQTIASFVMQNYLTDPLLSQSPFFFASPSNTLFGQGIEDELMAVMPFSEMHQRVQAMLIKAKSNETDNPIAFGIIPFSENNPVRFVIPEVLSISGSLRNYATNAEQLKNSNQNETSMSHATIESIPAENDYRMGVNSALDLFATSQLSKVVLSRSVNVKTNTEIKLSQLLKNLLAQNQSGYSFCVGLDKDNMGDKLIGVSPELLVSRKGSQVISNPLAGSRKRSDDVMINQNLTEELLSSGKDLHEHILVVEEIEKVLSKYCHNLYSPLMPSVIETQTMLHLSTELTGMLIDPQVSVLQLASELHPTPAVCGFPRLSAFNAIQQIEPFDRGYFTGIVGWCDSRGNGEWAVTIRCAKVQKKRLQIYAGAGIVESSEPQSELDETSAKMCTMLNAAGINPDQAFVA